MSTEDDVEDGCAGSPGGVETGFRQYRAPRSHGEAFVQPAFADVPAVLAENLQLLASHGAPFQDLRRRARRQLVDDAIRYTSAYRKVDWLDSDRADEPLDTPILMAGHQPSIFHPGVWFKNFALSHLAEQSGAIAVNLVIDNDVASSSAIRFPSVDPDTGDVSQKSVAYDIAGGGVPYEQTTISDRATFDHFAAEVSEAAKTLVQQPCVTQLWKHAQAAIARCGVAGCALAQARHGLEGEVGLKTLELPLGVVCRTTAFAEFVLSILSELPRFHRCYNDAANLYRTAHGIRSTAHPVPNLAEDDGWFEAPMWIYGNDSPQRKPAWVRLSDDELVISDRGDRELRIEIRYPKLAAEKLANFASPNFKLRPRALLTTMYARLVLSDLFLHGIGGGKYDQLGDMIIRSFFMVTPPQFMVISATVQLPDIDHTDYDAKIRRLKRLIRDTKYQPERFADQVSYDAGLLQRKREWLLEMPPKGERKAWHDELQRINSAMQQQLDEVRSSLRLELAEVQRMATSRNLLASREHPFCIFPLDYLTETYQSLLGS